MLRRCAIGTVATVLATVLVTVGTPSGAHAADDDLAAAKRRQFAAGVQVVPKTAAGAKLVPGTANPYTALLADPTTVDLSQWNRVARAKAAERATQMQAQRAKLTQVAAPPLVHDEAEPAGIFGANDTHATAELIKGLGTGKGENNRSRILGQFSPEAVSVVNFSPFAEDDGAIPLAGNTGIATLRRGIRLTSEIGNGPHGSAGTDTGDFDFMSLTVSAGQRLVADTDTPTGPLDTVLGLYDATGELIATNDDSGGTLDSLLQFEFPAAGTYYLMVSGFGLGTVFPADPFDPASGLGSGSEGPYDITVTVAFPDRDFYAVDLAAGDVLGASVSGTGTALAVRDEAGRTVMLSDQDASFIYAPAAPLPGGGNAVADHVAARAGRYTLEVLGGAGLYDVTLEIYRPGTETLAAGTVQTIFLDFDGARVNTAIWGGPGVREISPLAGFIGRWGLTAAQENAVINQTIAAVRENIRADALASGTNPRFALRILNSRDDADPFGQPNVHRIIVGGTIAESGISTIGIAQFIDPGNYATDDSALVLLDTLSNPTGVASLNTYITPASEKIKFIGRALGNVISHEAGHLYGNFHTNNADAVPNLMDAGGNFPGLFGVGPDGIGGTADDVDYDFGEDTFQPSEGFVGIEDTLNTTAWALTKGRKA
jgi:hypothetical protein